MEVLGRDPVREAYRVAADVGGQRVVGLIPETVMACGVPLTGGRGHGLAYDWIARHTRQIEETLTTLATGAGQIRPPFDTVVLAEE